MRLICCREALFWRNPSICCNQAQRLVLSIARSNMAQAIADQFKRVLLTSEQMYYVLRQMNDLNTRFCLISGWVC
jgi:hypothetical protein